MSKIYNDITETIGNTPLVRLNRTAKKHGAVADVLLKLEFFNPLSSVKDRIGVAMIDDALKSGRHQQGHRAHRADQRQHRHRAGIRRRGEGIEIDPDHARDDEPGTPQTAENSRRETGFDRGRQRHERRHRQGRGIAQTDSEQLHSSSNFPIRPIPEIHRHTTAEEIWRDTDGKVDFVVAGVGTGGTITGVAEVIKQRKPGFKAIAVEPAKSPVISGGAPGPHKLQGIGAGFIPGNLNTKIVDETIQVNEEDSGPVSKEVNQLDGIPVGISSGAAIWAALQVAKRPENKGKTIVAIVPSSAERYLSAWLFADVDVNSDNLAG